MNNRIANKILTCKSSLHIDEQKVLKAREHYFKNMNWFIKKGIYLMPIESDCRSSFTKNEY